VLFDSLRRTKVKKLFGALALILAAMMFIISPAQANEDGLEVGEYESFFRGQTQILNEALEATTKNLTIEIAEEDLKTLKQNNYKLCFAKKVGNNDYNVVWQSSDGYLINNEFSWTPQYQIFGSNTFQDSVTVEASTGPKGIGLGEQITLDKAGVFGEPSTGGPDTSITMHNEYGSIHPGVNQLSTAIDGTQTSTPIYVAVNSVVQGDTVLTPVDKVLVWFQQDIETSTMFSESRSNSIEVDLTDSDSATRKYQDEKWITP